MTDGGAFVNSSCDNALITDGNHDGIRTNGPPIDVVGGTNGGTVCASQFDPSNCSFYPAPTTGVPPVSQDPLAGTPAGTPPPCNGPQYTQAQFNQEVAQGGNISPGSYQSLDSGQHDMNLLPGIFCLTGGTLSSGNGNLTGKGVLIYLVDTAANINYAGQGSLDLEAPKAGDPNGCTGTNDTSHGNGICPYLGIVIYKVTGTNNCSNSDQDIIFNGQASMTVFGLIYAPYSMVIFSGSSSASLTMHGQTIAGCVIINGNGNINIVYEPKNTYSPPPSVRLDE